MTEKAHSLDSLHKAIQKKIMLNSYQVVFLKNKQLYHLPRYEFSACHFYCILFIVKPLYVIMNVMNVRIIVIPEEELLTLRKQFSRSPPFLCLRIRSELASLPPLGQFAFSCNDSPAGGGVTTLGQSSVLCFNGHHDCKGLNLSSLAHFLQSRLLPASRQS